MADLIDLSPAKNGGVVKEVLRAGVGDSHPSKSDSVKVHYVGTLQSTGDQFDSSRDRGDMFTFTLGKGQVIKAWDLGVASMKKGEIARLTCAPEFAYGEGGSPPKIPPNATLIFDVELFSWTGEDISPDRDESIMRSVIEEGMGYDTPNEGAVMQVHVVGYLNEHMFMDEDIQYPLGECTEQGLPEGIDKALKRFKSGERSRITLSPKWGYGSKGKPEWNIPPNSTIDFDITCKSYEKVKDSWSMSTEEKLEMADNLKERGTTFFKAGKNNLAAAKYNKVIELLQYETTLEGDKKDTRDKLYVAASSNLALVMLKNGENVEAIKFCDKVLELEGDNIKAVYRRAQAYLNMASYEEAMVDFKTVTELEPSNKAAYAAILKCKQALQQEHNKQKQIFANMFDKFAKHDATKIQKVCSETVEENGSNVGPTVSS